ncbi:MAG: hypothetical protein OZ921_21205 [Sorangiineae bacterium]|nr:hypothetical protein [Sorangiineae bacterium]
MAAAPAGAAEPAPRAHLATGAPSEGAAGPGEQPRAEPAGKPNEPAGKPKEPATPAPAADLDRTAAAPVGSAPAAATPAAPTAVDGDQPPFNQAAAAAALASAAGAASACRKEGDPSGTARVSVTFAPSGRVTTANVAGPPFAGTPTGGCIAATLKRAKVPPFSGAFVTVSKTVVIQ